uniref:Elongation of very long chain fatty acids protein n=1 Tax=Strigamia maritima TaxID=126957 RepID=T1IZZ6_STRMM
MDSAMGVFSYFQNVYDGYVWTLTLEEPLTQKWFLVKSPVPMLVLIFLYFNMVHFGPKIMQKREPYKLKWVLIVYNLGITILNLYIAVTLFHKAHKLNYSWICEPYRLIQTDDEKQIAFTIYLFYLSKVFELCDSLFFIMRKKFNQLSFLHCFHHPTMFFFTWIGIKWVPGGSTGALWWYWFSKLIEFTDTLFFILRKKDRQLTFLHIYHHSTMFFFWWIGVKWVPGGAFLKRSILYFYYTNFKRHLNTSLILCIYKFAAFVGAGLNSVVHVLMYSYYCLSALGPSVQKYLWWKKYLTMIQLAQFTIALVLGINGMRINCDFPKWMQYVLVTYMLSFIVLFGNFYRHAYKKRQAENVAKKFDSCKPITNGNGHTNGYAKQNGSYKN